MTSEGSSSLSHRKPTPHVEILGVTEQEIAISSRSDPSATAVAHQPPPSPLSVNSDSNKSDDSRSEFVPLPRLTSQPTVRTIRMLLLDKPIRMHPIRAWLQPCWIAVYSTITSLMSVVIAMFLMVSAGHIPTHRRFLPFISDTAAMDPERIVFSYGLAAGGGLLMSCAVLCWILLNSKLNIILGIIQKGIRRFDQHSDASDPFLDPNDPFPKQNSPAAFIQFHNALHDFLAPPTDNSTPNFFTPLLALLTNGSTPTLPAPTETTVSAAAPTAQPQSEPINETTKYFPKTARAHSNLSEDGTMIPPPPPAPVDRFKVGASPCNGADLTASTPGSWRHQQAAEANEDVLAVYTKLHRTNDQAIVYGVLAGLFMGLLAAFTNVYSPSLHTVFALGFFLASPVWIVMIVGLQRSMMTLTKATSNCLDLTEDSEPSKLSKKRLDRTHTMVAFTVSDNCWFTSPSQFLPAVPSKAGVPPRPLVRPHSLSQLQRHPDMYWNNKEWAEKVLRFQTRLSEFVVRTAVPMILSGVFFYFVNWSLDSLVLPLFEYILVPTASLFTLTMFPALSDLRIESKTYSHVHRKAPLHGH